MNEPACFLITKGKFNIKWNHNRVEHYSILFLLGHKLYQELSYRINGPISAQVKLIKYIKFYLYFSVHHESVLCLLEKRFYPIYLSTYLSIIKQSITYHLSFQRILDFPSHTLLHLIKIYILQSWQQPFGNWSCVILKLISRVYIIPQLVSFFPNWIVSLWRTGTVI